MIQIKAEIWRKVWRLRSKLIVSFTLSRYVYDFKTYKSIYLCVPGRVCTPSFMICTKLLFTTVKDNNFSEVGGKNIWIGIWQWYDYIWRIWAKRTHRVSAQPDLAGWLKKDDEQWQDYWHHDKMATFGWLSRRTRAIFEI